MNERVPRIWEEAAKYHLNCYFNDGQSGYSYKRSRGWFPDENRSGKATVFASIMLEGKQREVSVIYNEDGSAVVLEPDPTMDS